MYHATRIETFPGGVRYIVGPYGFMDSWGFAYSSNGVAALPGDSGPYKPIGNNWYIWTWHF
jgi:hypothetical protein